MFDPHHDSSTPELCDIAEKIRTCPSDSTKSDSGSCRDQINRYLRALVAVDLPTSLDDTLANDAHAPSDGIEDKKTTPCSRRRIIYLRDFGAISSVARSFLEELLAAIRLHRKASIQGSGPLDPSRLYRVVVVMGMSRPLKNDQDRTCFQFEESRLYRLVPRIETSSHEAAGLELLRAFTRTYLEREREAPPTPESDLLQWEWEDSDSDYDPMNQDVPTNRYSSSFHGTILAVFTLDLSPKFSEDWELEKVERLSILNDSILRDAIDDADGTFEGENVFKTTLGARASSTGNEVTDNNASVVSPSGFPEDLRQRVLPHWLGKRLASNACLLAHSAAHSSSIVSDSPSLSSVSSSIDTSSGASSRRVVVTAEIIRQAWNNIGALVAERRGFVKPDAPDEVSDETIQDSKLEKLKRESDLNKHEQALLSCVVDPGMFLAPFMRIFLILLRI
jgi:hypothetical protein